MRIGLLQTWSFLGIAEQAFLGSSWRFHLGAPLALRSMSHFTLRLFIAHIGLLRARSFRGIAEHGILGLFMICVELLPPRSFFSIAEHVTPRLFIVRIGLGK